MSIQILKTIVLKAIIGGAGGGEGRVSHLGNELYDFLDQDQHLARIAPRDWFITQYQHAHIESLLLLHIGSAAGLSVLEINELSRFSKRLGIFMSGKFTRGVVRFIQSQFKGRQYQPNSAT